MDINNKIIKIGMILIGITVLLCVLFAYTTKLKNPVFVTNYIENPIYTQDYGSGSLNATLQCSIQYITNSSDKREIVSISFKEEPNIIFTPERPSGMFYNTNSIKNYSESIYGRYSYRAVNLIAYIPDLKADQKDLQLSQGTIQFSNGDALDVNIGKIIFYMDKPVDGLIQQTYSESSNNGNKLKWKVNKDISITKLDSPFMEYMDSGLTLHVDKKNYRDIAGMEFKSGNSFEVIYTYSKSGNIESQFTNVDIKPKLYYKDVDGKEYFDRMYINYNSYYQYINYWKILEYLKAKGAV